MAYLSQGVAVPEKHSQAGLVSAGFAKEDANGIIPDLLQVRVQEERPKHASLIVPYKGYWFYIEESDISSKRTMGALNSLARLKIKAAAAQKIPVLTLPVAK